MKRHVLIVVVFLLAGAVVNVAVAWGCAYGGTKYETHRIEVLRTPETLYAVHVLTAFGRELLMLFPLEEEALPVFKGMGIEIDPVDEGRLDWSVIRQSGLGSSPSARPVYEEAAGWPQVCFRYEALATGFIGGKEFGGPRRHNASTGMSFKIPRGDRTLPLIPIWSGFAVNTAFYAVVLWLLIPGPFVLRRVIRVRRGLCPACAYPRGESDVCSECGKALPGRARVTT